jgi:hypothetical protein
MEVRWIFGEIQIHSIEKSPNLASYPINADVYLYRE